MRLPRFYAASVLLMTLAACALAAPIAQPQRIEVYPPQVTLDSQRACRQFVVTGYFDGEPRDLTSQAQYLSSDPKIVDIKGTRAVPASDGSASIAIMVGGQSAHVPVVVSNVARPDPVQFKFETVAVLTKQGCATGSCHGSPHGKGNFSLSLFGYNPEIDRISLTRDGFNRRVNVMDPPESLMLKKPLMEVSHVGGKRLMKTDTAFRILSQWIYEGASTPLPAVECTQIIVQPASNRVLRSPFLKQQISVLARYSDGTSRDVTAIATYTSSNAAVAEATADGLVTGKSRGQSAISVRYLDKLESVLITVIEDIPGFAWSNPPENSFIDRLVDEKLHQLQYLPSSTCNDETFVRRIYLDLTGLLPTADVSREFIADRSPDKRAKLIDRLLETEDFARFWAQKKADLMRVSAKSLKDGRAELFGEWIIDAQRRNVPYDQFARQILTASGNTRSVAPANYFEAVPTMEERTEMTAEIFMGSRLECTKCHNHPFENWTMKDYYSLAAVFVRTKDEHGEVGVIDTGEAIHPTSKQAMIPWGTPSAHMTVAPSDRRQVFADWLTAKGNPFFARVEANRIWSQLLGRGIVEPVDDFRSSNPPSNAPLLDALAAEFEKSGYDRKQMIRLICDSRTYQRSTQTNPLNEGEDLLFSHASARLLTAEQLKDAIGLVTGSLTPTPVIAKQLAETLAKLQAREAELDHGYAAWLTGAQGRAREMTYWAGTWYSVGPFVLAGDPVKEEFGPEKHAVNLSETFDNGHRAWRERLDYGDARDKQSLDGENNVVDYLFRTIHCDEDRTIKVQIKSSTGALVWLNEKRITPKLLAPVSDITVDLKAGENRLLIKAIVRVSSEFSFVPKEESRAPRSKDSHPAELPGYLVDLLLLAPDARSGAQQQAIREHYLMADTAYRTLRAQVQKLQARAEYATQQVIPANSAFLTTFGQPQRQSACACERLNSPTLLQALELLNGSTVSDMIGASPATYGKLDDDKLIDEIYLSSYSRLPTDKDRAAVRQYLKKTAVRSTAITDLVWAIVNTREFMFQH